MSIYQDRAVNLFKYLRDVYNYRNVVPMTMTDSSIKWSLFLRNIPTDEKHLSLSYRDTGVAPELSPLVAEREDAESVLFAVQKPGYTPCPALPDELKAWVPADWNRFEVDDIKALTKIENPAASEEGEPYIFISDFPELQMAFTLWANKRRTWVKKQQHISKMRRFFESLGILYNALERDKDTVELVVGQGMMTSVITMGENIIEYPLLVKKVTMKFDPSANVIMICDTDAAPSLGTTQLQRLDGIYKDAIKGLQEDLESHEYHPLDRHDTVDFLNRLSHQISQRCEYVDQPKSENPAIAPDISWVIYNDPVFFVRRRDTGMRENLNRIVEYTQETNCVPEPILQLMGKNREPLAEPVVTATGKPVFVDPAVSEILLSKEANEEQIEIAKVIEHAPAVVVQGPPGTGKTHTIANLLGHFLAQGKNILVTSYTSKALEVVKEKVVPELRDLCVSILDDSNQDMAASIDQIISYNGQHSIAELQEKAASLRQKRHDIITRIEDIKQHIYAIRNREYKAYVWGGKEYSLGEMASFVHARQQELDYLPGPIEAQRVFPLSRDEVVFLFKSNGLVSKDEESELILQLPPAQDLITESEFSERLARKEAIKKEIAHLTQHVAGCVDCKSDGTMTLFGKSLPDTYDNAKGQALLERVRREAIDGTALWKRQCIACTMQERDEAWHKLIQYIEAARAFSKESSVAALVGNEVTVPEVALTEDTMGTLRDIAVYLEGRNSFGFFGKLFHGDWVELCQSIQINGKAIASTKECDMAIAYITLILKRQTIGRMWDDLIASSGGTAWQKFGRQPEWDCEQEAAQIKQCLQWYQQVFIPLQQEIEDLGLPKDLLVDTTAYTTSEDHVGNLLSLVYMRLPVVLALTNLVTHDMPEIEAAIDQSKSVLQPYVGKSVLCSSLYEALQDGDSQTYTQNYTALMKLQKKHHYLAERQKILAKIRAVAPGWATYMEHRMGVLGNEEAPENLEEAWQFRQFVQILQEASDDTLPALETDEKRWHQELQKVTTELAQTLAWMHVLIRIQSTVSQQQDLKGWKDAIGRIGHGKGKNVLHWQRVAQDLMVKCQHAVPAWIMPMGMALNQLTPGKNSFDIVIVDEASQSDISSLAILFYAKKIIIVGDNEQVSPEAVGIKQEPLMDYQKMYFDDEFPNKDMYILTTSLYDLGDTTFQTRMLREHFRCVPDIIGYSNWLSYQGKIKPLRDDSNVPVKPATIAYRVKGKRDDNKVNTVEAMTIVALMMACMERPEYDDETFGAISLVGDEQANRIAELAAKYIDLRLYRQRRILCGNARQFQGDERGVIFLSLVDSADGGEQLRLVREGKENSTKRRYNVAASRAKDQLWVIHSLDSDMNLKLGDIRKGLLDYVKNPKSIQLQEKKVKNKAQSPFEEAVAMALIRRGYHIVQQWPVSSYYIDIVALCGTKKIAIECDGELYHSGYDKMLADMRRQADLERVGWQFIRIRGSEYFNQPEKTIERVIEKLTAYGIEPEQENQEAQARQTELEEAIKRRAEELVTAWSKNEDIEVYPRDLDAAEKPQVVQKEVAPPAKETDIVSPEEPVEGGISIELGDYITLYNPEMKESKTYKMMKTPLGSLTELARICLQKHQGEWITYQDRKYKITKVKKP